MKASELRIGNLAQDNLTKEILICCGLECDTDGKNSIITFSVLDRKKYPLPNGWKAEPIPLTEEWLLRLGFEKHSLNPYWFNKGIICISIVHKVELISWDRQIFKLDIEINHVHQLQNLYFALTNTELECTSK